MILRVFGFNFGDFESFGFDFDDLLMAGSYGGRR